VVFLDFPARTCLLGITERRLRHGRGQHDAIGVYERSDNCDRPGCGTSTWGGCWTRRRIAGAMTEYGWPTGGARRLAFGMSECSLSPIPNTAPRWPRSWRSI
jgi:hypothetical protein